MADKKILAVVGATGAQGGSLVRAILADPSGGFAARALTRKTDSPKAQELAALGAEVVAADLDDVASLERAFQGAWGAFCLTNFWEHFSPEREYAQAAGQALAARKAGVQHAMWSTLEDTRRRVPLSDDRMPTLMGRYKVPHFDAKGAADELFTNMGVPTTFLLTSFYWDNLIHFGMQPQRGADGKLAFTLPMGEKKLPGIAAEDIGKCAYGIFKKGTSTVGQTIAIAGEQLSGREMAEALSKTLGEDVSHFSPDFAAFRSFGFPGAEDLGNMFQFKHDFNEEFCGPRDPAVARELNPELQSFADFLARNGSRIPVK